MEKTLYATMTALPGHQDAVREMLSALADAVRAEPGNRRFVVYALSADPSRFHVEETYRDEAVFQAHLRSDHGRAFNDAIRDHVEGGRSDVVFLSPVA